jgi:hypothetical protein
MELQARFGDSDSAQHKIDLLALVGDALRPGTVWAKIIRDLRVATERRVFHDVADDEMVGGGFDSPPIGPTASCWAEGQKRRWKHEGRDQMNRRQNLQGEDARVQLDVMMAEDIAEEDASGGDSPDTKVLNDEEFEDLLNVSRVRHSFPVMREDGRSDVIFYDGVLFPRMWIWKGADLFEAVSSQLEGDISDGNAFREALARGIEDLGNEAVSEALSSWDFAEANARLGDVSIGSGIWTEDLRTNGSTGDLADVILMAKLYHRRFVVWIWEGDRDVEPLIFSNSDMDVAEDRDIYLVYHHTKDDAGEVRRHFDAILPQSHFRAKLEKRKRPGKRQRKRKQRAVEA